MQNVDFKIVCRFWLTYYRTIYTYNIYIHILHIVGNPQPFSHRLSYWTFIIFFFQILIIHVDVFIIVIRYWVLEHFFVFKNYVHLRRYENICRFRCKRQCNWWDLLYDGVKVPIWIWYEFIHENVKKISDVKNSNRPWVFGEVYT